MLVSFSNALSPRPVPALNGANLSGKPTHVLFQSVAICFLLCVFWQLAIGELNVHAQVPEYSAKAASLALLPDYVKWPTPATAALTVGILGDDPFGGALDKMNPKRSRNIEDLKDCQIVFIANSEREKVVAILESLAGASVLTVGESEGFAKHGGVIGFVVVGDQVRFEINTGAARRAGLGIDLRLLKLAVRVFNS